MAAIKAFVVLLDPHAARLLAIGLILCVPNPGKGGGGEGGCHELPISPEITRPIPADGRPMPAAEQPAATAHVIPMGMDMPVSLPMMPLYAIVMGDSGRLAAGLRLVGSPSSRHATPFAVVR